MRLLKTIAVLATATPLTAAQSQISAITHGRTRCGASYGYHTCPTGQCCSNFGFCGTSTAHCSSGCQSGECFTPETGTIRNTDNKGDYITCKYPGMIAITYDDGPHPVWTNSILDSLKKAGVKATFFWLGSLMAANPNVVRRALQEGHEIASHSLTHANLATLDEAQITQQIVDTENSMKDASGPFGVKPRFFRPPYGSTKGLVSALLTRHGYAPSVLWDLDTKDWETKNADAIVQAHVNMMEGKNPRTTSFISLMHDIHRSTADATDRLLEYVKGTGFVPVTTSVCLGEAAYKE